MVKIVCDTNVLIAALLSDKGASFALVQLCAAGQITGFTSKAMLREFKESLQRDFDFPLERSEQAVDSILQFLKLIEPAIKLAVVSDEDDNKILECAVCARANYLASWDKHLTDLKEYDGIIIAEPGRIIKELREVHGIGR